MVDIGQNLPMRLDHVSYVAPHHQVVDVVQRIGSLLSSTFLDGGIHPRFGTRNFVMPLLNKTYLEVVCPLEHPATDETPFGKAVKKRAEMGGGWLSWVLSTNEIDKLESRFGRKAVEGHRRKPDGIELLWKQIGVLGTLEDSQLPFFVEWQTNLHPSSDGHASASIDKIEIIGSSEKVTTWVGFPLQEFLGNVGVTFKSASSQELNGILSVEFRTRNGIIKID